MRRRQFLVRRPDSDEIANEKSRQRLRDKTRIELVRGTEDQRYAVSMAEHGFGVGDIVARCRGVTTETARMLVLGLK